MKNIALFCDGTWQHLDQPHPTNVVNLARAALPSGPEGVQLIYYDDGVGVSQGVLSEATQLLGGALGKGLDYKVLRAYEFLCLNYEPRDRIFIFGFSRGAYTARSLAGLLRWAWILTRDNLGRSVEAMALYRSRPEKKNTDESKAAEIRFQEEAQSFRDRYAQPHQPFTGETAYQPGDPDSLTPAGDCAWVQYVGVWDTVGSLGIPSNLAFAPQINQRFQFYDTSLSRFVRSARHAVAIDERRKTFSPTLWDNIDPLNANAHADPLPYGERPYQQQWFPGVHGSVGGGGPDGGLSLLPMLWVAEGARRAGLAFNAKELSQFAALAHPEAPFGGAGFSWGEFIMELDGLTDRAGPDRFDEVSDSARRRWKLLPDYRPKPLTRRLDVVAELNGAS